MSRWWVFIWNIKWRWLPGFTEECLFIKRLQVGKFLLSRKEDLSKKSVKKVTFKIIKFKCKNWGINQKLLHWELQIKTIVLSQSFRKYCNLYITHVTPCTSHANLVTECNLDNSNLCHTFTCPHHTIQFHIRACPKMSLLAQTGALVATYDAPFLFHQQLFAIFTQPTPQDHNTCSNHY